MGSTAALIWTVWFSAIGMGYFMYGKAQRVAAPMFCGVALMVYPYFVSTTWVLVLIGVVLCVLPYHFRRRD